MINFIILQNYIGKISDISWLEKRPLGTLLEDDIHIRHTVNDFLIVNKICMPLIL